MLRNLHAARRIQSDAGRKTDMKTAFFQSSDFKFFAEVTKVDLVKDSYSLKITSQWDSAKNPEEEQTQFQVTCSKADLLALVATITRGVA